MVRARESTPRVDGRLLPDDHPDQVSPLTALVGALLVFAAFSAASNVLWAGNPGGDRRAATTSTSGKEGPSGRRRLPREAKAVASGAGERAGGCNVDVRVQREGGLANADARGAECQTVASGG